MIKTNTDVLQPFLGLKASTNETQIDERLAYHPQVFEFYTQAQDVTPNGLQHLREMIDHVHQAQVAHVIIHHPMGFKGAHNEMSVNQNMAPDRYRFLMQSSEQLIALARDTNSQLLLHGSYNVPQAEILQQYPSIQAAREVVFNRLDHFQTLGGAHVMFENSISPLFAFGDPTTEQLVIQHGYRLCYDTSHAFIVLHGNNQALQASMARLKSQIVHYHFVDSMGQYHDSLPLGQGKIDWQPLSHLVNPNATNIFEINLKDQNNSQEMRDSYDYLKSEWYKAVRPRRLRR